MGGVAGKVVAIERISRAYRYMIVSEAKRHGITLLQAQIILYLSEGPSDRRKIMDLSRELGVSQPVISDSVNNLVRKGLVAKETLESDKRAVRLRLAERGEEIARNLKKWQGEAEGALKAAVDEERAGEILEALLKYIASLHRRGAIKVARTCMACRYLSIRRSGGGKSYYCRLLKLTLGREGLRLDCEDHRPLQQLDLMIFIIVLKHPIVPRHPGSFSC